MPKRRLIPVVLLDGGRAVQSKGFRRRQVLGNPVTIVERLADWSSDELIYLDITRDGGYDLGRDDLAATNHGDPLAILEAVADRCFMPLTFGGGIRSVDDAVRRVERGADKIAVTTAACEDPALISQIADRLGRQCVVVGIDARRRESGGWDVMSRGGRHVATDDVARHAIECVDRGAGEILLQSVDRDGRGMGYDLELIESVAASVPVPVVALGGAGDWSHFEDGVAAGADAVAAANIFNHREHAVHHAKVHLHDRGLDVRPPSIAPAPTAAPASLVSEPS